MQFLIEPSRCVNRGYAHTVLKPLLLSLLLRFTAAVDLQRVAMASIARKTFFSKQGLSKPRKTGYAAQTDVAKNLLVDKSGRLPSTPPEIWHTELNRFIFIPMFLPYEILAVCC